MAGNPNSARSCSNLGQGVANDDWKGRARGASLDDYPGYVRGSDNVSFDVYPVAGIDRADGGEPSGTSQKASTGW